MAEFEPIPDPPTPEQVAAEQEDALRKELQRIRIGMIATAGHFSQAAFELVMERTRNMTMLASLAASTGAALEAAERAEKLLAAPSAKAKREAAWRDFQAIGSCRDRGAGVACARETHDPGCTGVIQPGPYSDSAKSVNS